MRLIFISLFLLVWGSLLTVSAQEPVAEAEVVGAEAAAEGKGILDLRKEADAAAKSADNFKARGDAVANELSVEKEKLVSLPKRMEQLQAELEATVLGDDILAIQAEESRANYEAAKAARDAFDLEAQRRQRRLDDIPSLLAPMRKMLSDGAEALGQEDLAGQDQEMLLVNQRLLEETIRSLEEERKFYREANELLAVKRDLAVRETEALGKIATAAQDRADKHRVEMAKKAATDAEAKADDVNLPPALARIAEQNEVIAKARTGEDGLAVKIADANGELQEVRALLERIDRDHAESVQQVKLIEAAKLPLGKETGSLLRAEKSRLPRVEEIQLKVREEVRRLTEARLEREDWRKTRRQRMSDVEAKIEQVVAKVGSEYAGGARGLLDTESEVRGLLDTQSELLNSLIGDYLSYTEVLSDTLSARRDMISRVVENTDFIEQRVLWIRSAPVLHESDFSSSFEAFGQLFSAREWLAHGGALLADMAENFPLWVLTILVLAYLLRHRRKHIRLLRAAGDMAAKRNCRAYLPTLKAVVYTVLIALPIPLVIGFLGWRSFEVASMGSWAEQISHAMQVTFFPALALTIARGVCRSRGLAQCHLGLAPKKAALLFKGFTWALIAIIPLVYFREGLFRFDFNAGSRICFIASMLVISVFAFKVLRPSVGLMAGEKRSLWQSCAYPIYLGILGTAIGLAIATYLGYFYTVTELAWRIRLSVWAVLAVTLCGSIVMRLLIVSRRRVAFAQRIAAFRAAQAERAEVEGEKEKSDGPNLAEIEADMVNITRVEAQTQSLIRMAAFIASVVVLWGVWVEVAPSLKVLDGVELWSTAPAEVQSSGDERIGILKATSTESASGKIGVAEILSTADSKSFVSLADLGLAIITLFLTYFAASNVPGLLEITLLQRLRLKPGGSYTATTVVRYVIVLVGIITAFAYVDITWGKVQWIAAAITLGVGFGLQEVFANFVAGLILLFERPIRLGDFVTVGGVNGTVTQIRMRATTIRDRGNKELLVPNKEFITGQLVNWTLTDLVIRLDVPVGIAYGSDTELARKLLLEIAEKSKTVLKDPEPRVVFGAFGASSLDFELRVFIRGADDLVRIGSDLHFAVDKVFREHEIEIAFPQQDLHIRTVPEGLLGDAKPSE